jgi:DNA adenine methylase
MSGTLFAPARIGALAPWFGGKRRLAPRIVEALGPHRTYWEPFCGSAAVVFAKEPSAMETINDLHGHLVNVARVVQSDDLAPMLFDRMLRTVFSDSLFASAVERLRERGSEWSSAGPDLDAAYDYLVACWSGRNGVSGTRQSSATFCLRYTGRGGAPAKRFASVAESIPAWWHRLRNVAVLRRDAFELIPRIADDPDTAIYVDPPYIAKGASYVHDFQAERHEELARHLLRFQAARVVVSYYDHPAVRDLYPADRWEWIDCLMSKSLASEHLRGRRGTTPAPEVLIRNRTPEPGRGEPRVPPRTRRLSATAAAVGGARRQGQLGGHEQGV